MWGLMKPLRSARAGAFTAEIEIVQKGSDAPDLSRECTSGLDIRVLRGEFDILADLLLQREEVQRRRGDDNLCAS